jgi:hypothetical protein
MKAFAVFVDLNDLSVHESRLGYVVGSNEALWVSGESYVSSLVWAMEFNKWRS